MMRYWWVSHGQTYKHEFIGGYLWSPQRTIRGQRNHFWDTMREVAPGDVVLSYADQRIRAVGRARTPGYDCPRPEEFQGSQATAWGVVGWRVDVDWVAVRHPFFPRDHIAEFRDLLPERYSPLHPVTGDGNQIYLAELPHPLAAWFLGRLEDLAAVPPEPRPAVERADEARERIEEAEIARLALVDETTRNAVIAARRGQGAFRRAVVERGPHCRVSGVADLRLLTASHIWPWHRGTNGERLDGANGLMLSPAVDRLFDQGFISFTDGGTLIESTAIDANVLRQLGIPIGLRAGAFAPDQRVYLQRHRDGYQTWGPIFRGTARTP